MNIYAIIILATICIEFILTQIADILNLKNLKTTLPQEFAGIYDEEKYKKSQEYTRSWTRFGFVTDIFDLVVVLLFWFSGGFNWLDGLVRSFNLHIIWTGLLYISILVLLKSLLSLPFDVYSTFVIEEKFGFNKTTVITFIMDRVKALALGVIIGGPLLALILAVFQYFGSLAWLYGWILVTIISLILQYLAPTLILPLFNKFEPLDNNELKEKIFEYARSVNYPLAAVLKMDGSKRSSKSNAFFTGIGKNKRIALYDTLIEKHNDKEMVAILAHEIGHYKKKHILIGMIIGIIHTGIIFFLLSIFLYHQGLFDAFYMEHMSVYAGLLFFGMLYAPIELLLSMGLNIVSRSNEFQADKFAVKSTKDKESMILALKKLSVNNLTNLTPHPFYSFLNYSHPPMLQRIAAMNKVEL